MFHSPPSTKMISGKRILTLAAAAVLLTGSAAFAASPATDNAGNYSNTFGAPNYWGNGSNEGTGFGPWNSLQFNFLNEYNPVTPIGTGPTNNVFNLFTSGFSTMQRSFTGNLVAGDTFRFQLDLANTIDAGGGVGFTVNSANGNPSAFNVNLDRNSNTVAVATAGGVTQNLTGFDVAALANGVNFAFTLTSANTWSFTASSLDNSIATTLTGGGVDQLNGFIVYAYNVGNNNDVFSNNFSVTAVPEPTVTGMILGAGLICFALIRRRRMLAQ